MKKYCSAINQTIRWKTRDVLVGVVGIGGMNPVRIQSMTTSPTTDITATIDQIIKLADMGCDLVRVTVQGMKEVNACEKIKSTLLQKGYTIPLIADIHFFPNAAIRVVEFVDKIRINPGNYADKQALTVYTPEQYQNSLDRIEQKLVPLIDLCKKYKRALRIGTNHGSLSNRIMYHFGDTPIGMVESALEFARICRKYDYHDLIFSMKSSNPNIMIASYRLLVQEMMKLGWNYPLHIGVTESGQGEEGRIKSSVGIGSLLLDGLGDTIRVSLTEDPWAEILPCKQLISLYNSYLRKGIPPFEEQNRLAWRMTKKLAYLHSESSVFLRSELFPTTSQRADSTPDVLVYVSNDSITLQSTLSKADPIPLLSLESSYMSTTPFALHLENTLDIDPNILQSTNLQFIVVSPKISRIHYCRYVSSWLGSHNSDIPLILHFTYSSILTQTIIEAATEFGSLLCDGIGNGIWLDGPYPIEVLQKISLSILQATRKRITKTEFISCPSCGRTLFDLQLVSKQIRERTAHLPGIKIAIMGCIVNGPGEMADADFGYVGSKPGKVDLYVNKKCIEKDIESTKAVDRLIALIKRNNRWIEPESTLTKV
ncbi:MAG: (E)-4-hydroxy-3-methylbut-2-enyl-diphosphate synthase [Chlamydiales bacterium]